MTALALTSITPDQDTVFKRAEHTFSEIGKVASLATVLSLISGEAFLKVAVKPISDEIIFRGCLLQGIRGIQNQWNKYTGKELTLESEKSQKCFRICLTALLYSLDNCSCFLSYPVSGAALVIVAGKSIFDGVLYGHLAEETNSIALPIIFHSAKIANTLFFMANITLPHALLFIFGEMALSGAAYCIARNGGLEGTYRKFTNLLN